MSTTFLSVSENKHIPRILGLGLFLQQLDAMVLNTAIPQMSVSLDTSPLSLKLAITSYLLTLAMFIPVSGYFADRFGTKRIFAAAMLVFLLGSVICGVAHSIEILIAGRLVQGLGAAMVTPVGRLILMKSFSRTDFIMAFTYYTIMGQVGLVVGPVLGGFLTTFMGWRYIFFINVPVVLLALYLVQRFIPNHVEEEFPEFDWVGFVIFGVAAGSITFAFSWLTEQNFTHVDLPLLLLTVGICLAVVYYRHARKTPFPSLDIRIFRIETFRLATFGGFLFRIGMAGFGFLIPLQMQLQFGYNAFESGLILLPSALAFLVTKTIFKNFLQRYGFRKCLLFTPVVVVVSFIGLSWINSATPLWVILLLMTFIGFFTSLQYSFTNTLNLADIPKQESSRATSVSVVFQQLGISFSVCFCAGLLVSSSHLSGTALLGAMAFHYTYLGLSAFTLLSTLLFLQLPKTAGESLLQR